MDGVMNVRGSGTRQAVAHGDVIPAGNDHQTIGHELGYVHPVELPGIRFLIGEMQVLQDYFNCTDIVWRRSTSIEQQNLRRIVRFARFRRRAGRQREQPNARDEQREGSRFVISTER